MPELPEVETIVKYLRPKIRGKRILGIEVSGKRVLRRYESRRSRTSTEVKSDFKKIREQILGRKIESLERIGKNIIFGLSGGQCLAMHLMMTGQLLFNPPIDVRHERLRIRLSGGDVLMFNDARQFGWCRVLRGRTSAEMRFDLNVGQDALTAKFKKFKSLIARRGIIKNLLLNQKVISGIGNIYADEILWEAGIHPLRKAEDLTDGEVKKLYAALGRVLRCAVKKEGTSSRDYRKPDGGEGGYYALRKAYQRSGEPCSRDGAIMKRMVIGQRSTHFCPKHQK